MEGTVWIGVGFAVLTAFFTNLAFLWKHRGAVAAPAVTLNEPIKSAADLFRSKWWAIGWATAVVGWVFHVGSLAFAPLSLAQAVISGGFVILAVLAERMFGFSLQRRQWLGVALVAVGLGFLGATADVHEEQTRYSIIGIAIFQAALLAIGLLLVLLTRRSAVNARGDIEESGADDARDRDGGGDARADEEAPGYANERTGEDEPRTAGPPQAPVTAHETHAKSRTAGLLLGTAAGLAFGVSDVSIKALAEAVIGDMFAIVSPWAVTAVAASIGAFYASARSLQIGEGIVVITATTAAANISTIAGGIIVFGEALGQGFLEVGARLTAFALVIAGATLMPGPTRAAEKAADEEREQSRAAQRPSGPAHRSRSGAAEPT